MVILPEFANFLLSIPYLLPPVLLIVTQCQYLIKSILYLGTKPEAVVS